MHIRLNKEYTTFLECKDQWITEHLNEFVLIKGTKIIGFYSSYRDALENGLKRFGNVPFFIKVIMEEEEVHFFQQGNV